MAALVDLPELDDARVAARPGADGLRDLAVERLDGLLVAQSAEGLPTASRRRVLRLVEDRLDEDAQRAGLAEGRRDALVLDQRGRHRLERRLPVGSVAADFFDFESVSHGILGQRPTPPGEAGRDGRRR